MKSIKQISLRKEKKWILTYSLTLTVLCVFILVRPVYSRTDVPLIKSPIPDAVRTQIDSGPFVPVLEFDTLHSVDLMNRYQQYHREHMILFRKFFGTVPVN